MALLDKLRKLSHPKIVVNYIKTKIYNIPERIRFRKIRNIGNFSIISNNCIGGFLYQKCGIKYYSPTIGLQFPQEDFVKFCRNLEYYLQEELKESNDKMQDGFTKLGGGEINFPVGRLADITIYFQHFHSFEEAKVKWDERKDRINRDNLFFIFVGYDNTPKDVFEEFNGLPLKHKLLLTNEKMINSNNSFAMHNGKHSWFDKMGNLRKKYYEQFDYYKWFIEGIS